MAVPAAPPDPRAHTAAPTADAPTAHTAGAPPRPPANADAWDRPGLTIGPYTLVSLLGEGGFGSVYLAEQSEPVRRRVALKVLKPGMDSRYVLARFEAERQALAIIDHPCVARVFDAGATDQGRPFFVMEHVAGEPITAYCDRRGLDTRRRLELFLGVCAGVHHAHQKGVIHRDLKPSNVLVVEHDGKATPKVIDFGVAKATTQPLTDRTLHTEAGQVIGTLEYMSPEQAGGRSLDVDTRADVYSLGVLLYELLTGRLPFDSALLRRASLGELDRIIREVDPPRPSTRVQTADRPAPGAPRSRDADPHRLSRELRGDLDWITLKAMEKDRSRRYDSASDLAADIERHLTGQPVSAGPPTLRYRAGKYVRRNKLAVAAGAAVAAAIVLMIAGLGYGLVRATAAQARAEASASEAQAVNDFLNSMLRSVNPAQLGGDREVTVRQVLDESAGRLGAALAGQPAAEARVRMTIGESYLGLGLPAQAEPQLAAARDLLTRLRGPDDRATLTAVNALATAVQDQGDLARAETLFRDALAAASARLGPDDPETLTISGNLALLLYYLGRSEEAVELTRRTREAQERVLGPDDERTLDSTSNLASMLHAQGKVDQAERLSREALERWRRVAGEDHPKTLIALNNLGTVLFDKGDNDAAEALYREVLAVSRRVLGEDHPDTITSLVNLAGLLLNTGQNDEAESMFREAVAARLRVQGPGHPDTVHAMTDLALLLHRTERYADAEAVLRPAIEAAREHLGNQAPETLSAVNLLGDTLVRLGRLEDGEALLREAVRGLEQSGDATWRRGYYRRIWANALRKLGRLDEARAEAATAYEHLKADLGEDHKQARSAAQVLQWIEEARGDAAAARVWQEKVGPDFPTSGR